MYSMIYHYLYHGCNNWTNQISFCLEVNKCDIYLQTRYIILIYTSRRVMFTVDLNDGQWLQCMCTQILNTFTMKGTIVPNPRRSSACDCTCVLTRIDHCLVTLSCLPCAFCFVPAYWGPVCKVRSRIPDAFSQALVQLIFSFSS